MKKLNILLLISVAFILLISSIYYWRSSTKKTESPAIDLKFSSEKPPSLERPHEWEGKNDKQLPPANPKVYDPTLPQWKEYRRRNKEDMKWKSKMPIEFYGKVIDEKNNPVSDVTINYGGITHDKPNFEGTTRTDANGLFKVEGVRGNHLSIREIKKEGYYRSYQNAQTVFEYAQFFNENYHIPDPNQPVIFRLRKKGEAEPLLVYEKEFRLTADQSVTMDLLTGENNIAPTTLQINLLTNANEWTARLSMAEGGIQINTNEFPFEAPETGYESEILINYQTPKPINWQNPYKGGSFFVKTSQGYALVELKTLSGKRWIKIKPYFNPSGSRNLEFDEKKKLPGSD